MAEEGGRPGAFMLEVALSGKVVTGALAKYITSQKDRITNLETLFADVSISASLLADLGTDVNKHADNVYIRDDITRPICEICREDFEKLQVVLREASQSGMRKSNEGTDAWTLFCAALGGRMAARDFCRRIESTRHSLLLFVDTIKYSIYKQLHEENRLDPMEEMDFNSLKAKLPQIATTLDQAEEQRSTGNAAPAPRLEEGATKLPTIVIDDLEDLSEDTLAEEAPSSNKGKVLFGNDHNSTCSFDSVATEQFLDTTEIYEEWVLRWKPSERNRTMSWSLMGLRFSEYEELPSYWSLEAQFRSQAELKAKHRLETHGTPKSEHEASIKKATRALPTKAQDSLRFLLFDRENAACGGFRRQWCIAGMKPIRKSASLFGSSSKKTEWLILLRGETIDEMEKTRPGRHADGWLKPVSRREYKARQRSGDKVIWRDRCATCQQRSEVLD